MNNKERQEELRKAIARQLQGELQHCIDESDKRNIDQIFDRISRSDVWRKFQKAYLLNLDPNEYRDNRQQPEVPRDDGTVGLRPRNGSTVSLGSFLTESSYNRDEFDLSPEQIHELCNLFRSSTPSSKLHAVDILNNLSSFENVVTSDEWPVLEEQIRSMLWHPSTIVKRETLRLYWVMLSSGGVVFEKAYSSLLMAANKQVCTQVRLSAVGPSPHSPIDIVSILNTYHKNIPRHWLRFPRKSIRHVIEQTLTFMDDGIYENFTRVWKAFAVVDCHAVWLGNWLFGSESRAVLFESLVGHTNILLHSVQLVTNFRKFPELCERNTSSHVYAASFLVRVLRYEAGQGIVGSLGSNAVSKKTWFDVLIQVVLFTKVIWTYKYEKFSDYLPLLAETVSAVCSLTDGSIAPQQADTLVSNLAEISKSLPSERCSTHILSACLRSATWTTTGLALITNSRYRACRSDRVIFFITKRAVERSCGDTLCVECSSNLLEVCARIVRDPNYLLSDGCATCVRLLASVLEQSNSQEQSLKQSVTSFVKALFSTSLGATILCAGTLAETHDSRIRELSDIYDRVKYCSTREGAGCTQEGLLLAVRTHFWNSKSDPDLNFGLAPSREKLLCLMFSFRNCKMLLNRRRDSSNAHLWNDIIFLPEGKMLSEDSLILSLSVLKGLVCCLKTCIFLKVTHLVDRMLQELLEEFQNDDAKPILNEVSALVIEIQGRLTRTRQAPNQKDPGKQHHYASAPSKRFIINLKHPQQREGDLEALLATNTVTSAGFADFIEFDEGERYAAPVSAKPATEAQSRGIQMTLEYGEKLGLLSPDGSKHFQALANLTKKSKSFYGASCCSDSYDFLLATVFLLLRGDERRTFLMHKFLCDRDCYALYFPDMYGVCDTLVCSALCQLFEVIVHEHLPRLYHAFAMCHCEPSSVLRHWTGQCFWDYLDFDEIAAVLLMVVVHGGECLLYICVAMLKHVEDSLLRAFIEGRFLLALKETQVEGFRLASYVGLIRSLALQYRDLVKKSLSTYKH